VGNRINNNRAAGFVGNRVDDDGAACNEVRDGVDNNRAAGFVGNRVDDDGAACNEVRDGVDDNRAAGFWGIGFTMTGLPATR